MTEPVIATCHRGHLRTPENTVVRQHRSGDKVRTIQQCRICARAAAAARRDRDRSQGTPPNDGAGGA